MVEFEIAPSKFPLAIDALINIIVIAASGHRLSVFNKPNFNRAVARGCITINLNDVVLNKGVGANLFDFVLI